MLILMLGHQAGVGKDTLAELLVANAFFTRFAFSDKLKSVCADLYDLSHDQLHGTLKNVVDERYNMTPRQILQTVGQDQFKINKCVWVDYVCKQIEKLNLQLIVITDFRFPHEIERMTKNFPFARILPIKITRQTAGFTGSSDLSETALLEFDWYHIIDNNGTKEDLYNNFWRKYYDKQ